MQHYSSLEEVELQNAHLTIGVFDGVHRGHQQIVRRLVYDAHAQSAPAVVLTFDPHPASVLSGQDIKYLTTPQERAEILGGLGIDFVVTQRFTHDFSTVSAQEFMSRLKKHLGLKRLLIGYDFALGRGRPGNAPRLTELPPQIDSPYAVLPA